MIKSKILSLFILINLVITDVAISKNVFKVNLVDTISTGIEFNHNNQILFTSDNKKNYIYYINSNTLEKDKIITEVNLSNKYRKIIKLNKFNKSFKRENINYLEFDDSKFFIGRQFGIEVYNFEGNLIKTIKDTNFNKILFLDNYIAIIQFGINFSLSGGTKLKIKLLDKTNFKEIKSQQFDINGVQSVMLGTNNFVVFKNNIYFAESFTGNIFKINSSLEKVDSLKIFEFSELRSNICDSLKKSIDYFNKFGSFSNNIFDSMNIYINRVNWISGILADDSELIIVENSKNNRLDYFSNLINFNSKKIIRQELFKFKDVNNICKLKLNLISNSVKYLPSQNIGFSLSESGFFNCSKFNSWDDYISTMEKYFDERKMYYTIKIFN